MLLHISPTKRSIPLNDSLKQNLGKTLFRQRNLIRTLHRASPLRRYGDTVVAAWRRSVILSHFWWAHTHTHTDALATPTQNVLLKTDYHIFDGEYFASVWHPDLSLQPTQSAHPKIIRLPWIWLIWRIMATSKIPNHKRKSEDLVPWTVAHHAIVLDSILFCWWRWWWYCTSNDNTRGYSKKQQQQHQQHRW